MRTSSRSAPAVRRGMVRLALLSVLLPSALLPPGLAQEQAPFPALPPGIAQALPQPRLSGQGQMRFLGLRIYDARLWVGPRFEPQAFAAHPLALELHYHRAFSARAIAERSVQEITRQRALDADQIQRWQQALADWLPDVAAGDRLTGLYLPGQGMRLWRGEHALGVLPDAELARHFFGIWLSPQTSEPRLRAALLAADRGDGS